MTLQDAALLLKIDVELENLFAKVDETVAQQERRLEASRKMDELESKLALELKLSEELSALGAAWARRLARAGAAALAAPPLVTRSDQARLAAGRDMYLIAKELMAIRWDFDAPPDVAKGFVKNESRKVLEAFSVECGAAGGAAAAAALWPRLLAARAADKENLPAL